MSVTKKRISMNFGYDNMTVNQLMISRKFYYVTLVDKGNYMSELSLIDIKK